MLYDAPEKYSYDVALSFPGELRSLAKALSDTLKTKSSGLRVFCETDTVGKSAEAVVSGYATQAILIVPFFLKQYGYSEFCQKEWYAIQSNWDIFHDRILPLRFDKTFPVYGLSDYIDLTASSSELAAIADQVLKKLDEIKQQWSMESLCLQVVSMGGDTDRLNKLCNAVFAHSRDIVLAEAIPESKDAKEKATRISALTTMFSDLVLVVYSASTAQRTLHTKDALYIARKRARTFKRTLLLIEERDKKLFEELSDQPSIKVCYIQKSSQLPIEASEYLSMLTGAAVCNLFFEDSVMSEIDSLRRDLFAVYPSKADAVRCFSLSMLRESSFTHCTMLDCASQTFPLRENIYLISEGFMELVADKAGEPQRSSLAALFPRIVAYRTKEHAKQSFMFTKDSATRILGDKYQREKLTNYWRYAEPLLYKDITDLKARIEGMLANFSC